MANASLVILAAGMGSRYGGLKQIDPMGPSGEIVIEYSIYDAIQAGFDQVVFVIRKDIETDFRECVGQRVEDKIEVKYVFQELNCLPDGFSCPAERQKPWGTGHAILMAETAVNCPFAVINADDFYGRQAYMLMAEHLKNCRPSEYSMVAFDIYNTLSDHGHVSRGVCTVDEHNNLSEVVEVLKIVKEGDCARYHDQNGEAVLLDPKTPVSLNFWGFTPQLFQQLNEQFINFLKTNISVAKSEFFIPTVVDNLVKSGDVSVSVMQSSDKWFGVTYPEDKATVHQEIGNLINHGVYPKALWS